MAERRDYETTLDRVGLALALGGVLGGLGVALLALAGGTSDGFALLIVFAIGTLFWLVVITAFCAPLWLALHRAGYRRAWHAAALGAVLLPALLTIGQLMEMPAGGDTMPYRWLRALATSALIALPAMAVALVMWRVAYRSA